ncbi:hypothetical protein AMATHDRAFT_55688 [Amanita thiersii Skay4041]|uniref:F-box domain-containing protein n=1 Tax=Amanita thiersii Skay4041 TaxID=703135 RepID=A0A2A9NXL7_9AGAR|nr:hypothetical protein AMATHDRAFT_55688 [Amanita thiersii Skay4041]
MEAYLSRSGPCPVDILLNVAVPDQEPASVAVCLLLPHSTRWRRLCFISSYDMSSNLAPFYRVSAPNLEYISLRTGELIEEASSSSRIYPNCPSPVPQILNDVPSLTFVRLAGAALWKLQPPMHGITILDLEGSPSMYMTAQQLQSFLATTPSLVSLSLSRYNIVAQQEHLEVIPMQPMCSLRYMRICHEETRAGDLVSLMGLPVIETFKLQDLDSFNCRVLPSVHSITFIACSLSHIELRDITHSFPSLLSLTMDQSVQVLYTVLGFPAGEMLPWPSLEMITIYDLIPINVDMFCNMIHSRCHVKSKLKTVRLNRRSRTVLRSKGRLEWLCALVHVESYDLDEVWPPNMQCYDPDDSWNN